MALDGHRTLADHDNELRKSAVNVAVIAFDGEVNPSTRLRILQYIPALEREGFRFSTCFVPQGAERDRFDENRLSERIAAADVVFVQRVLERPLLRLLERSGKPVIFDFDDALHYIRQSQYPAARAPRGTTDYLRNTYRTVVRGSRYYSGRKKRLDRMLALATTIIAGNEWLVGELGLDPERTIVLPTSVWVSEARAKVHEQSRPVTLGWIGVRSNQCHLDILDEPFRELRRRYGDDVELKVVSSAPTGTALVTRFEPWSLEEEDEAVLSFDIGLMPLQDDPFSRGKCAFKAIQCMSHGVPVVASPVGANNDVVTHGVNGYLADSADQWQRYLAMLIGNSALRARLGEEARATVQERYASESVAETLATRIRIASRVLCSGNPSSERAPSPRGRQT